MLSMPSLVDQKGYVSIYSPPPPWFRQYSKKYAAVLLYFRRELNKLSGKNVLILERGKEKYKFWFISSLQFGFNYDNHTL